MQLEGKFDDDALECNCQLLPTVQLLVNKYQRTVDRETNANLSAHELTTNEIPECTTRRISIGDNHASLVNKNLPNDDYVLSDGVSEISSNGSIGSTQQFIRIPNIMCPLHSRSSEQYESNSYFVRVFNETERKNRNERYFRETIQSDSSAVFPVTNYLHCSRMSTMTTAGISRLRDVETRRMADSGTSFRLDKRKSSSIGTNENLRRSLFHVIILIIGLLLMFSVVFSLIYTKSKQKSKSGLWDILWILYGPE